MRRRVNKRIFFTLFIALTVSGFIVICTLAQTVHQQRVESKLAAAAKPTVFSAYIVRETNGKIGVYRGESVSPYMIIDFSTSLLSDYDREMLEEGVVLETEAELKRFIEDFVG